MIKLVQYIAVFFLAFLASKNISFGSFGKDDVIPRGESIVPAGSLPSGTGFLDGIAEYIKDTVFGVLVLIVVGMFVFIGFRLIIARGNAEEFTKAMKSLVYVIVGLFVVSIAWLGVRLISGLEIN